MRQPSIGRLIALLTGATVVLLLTIDTTMACRFLLRHRYCSPCPPVAVCRMAPPVYCGEPVDSCCGAGEVVVDEYGVEGQVIEAKPAQPMTAPDVDMAPSVVPDTAASPAPMPEDLDAAPAGDRLVEPAIVEEPADDFVPSLDEAPADLPSDELPADDLPSDDLPTDDLFGAPAEAAPPTAAAPTEAAPPAAAPADDLFGPPADVSADDLFNEPAPADAMPADDLDVFDTPATDAPAEDLFGAPADDAGDLLEEAAPLNDGTDLPGFGDPVPADAPADTVPKEDGDNADSLDDLFGSNNRASDAEPRTAATHSDAPAGDLFEGLDAPVEDPAPAATDDLLEAPAEAAPPEKANSVDDLDDLFGAQPVPPLANPTQATKPVTEETSIELPVRTWTDNTGQYQTVGRLVKVSPTHVRLLKDNGRFSTVPKHRLSEADLAYVQDVTKQLGVEYFDQIARR